MKKASIFLGLILLFTNSPLLGQTENEASVPAEYSETVASLDQILEGLYAVISGEKGEARDWDLFRHLFHPEAKLIPSGRGKSGAVGARYMSPEDYINSSGNYLVQNGFFEKEIHREVQSFGSMTHVFSTYESYHSEADSEPFARGINSIQLLNDGERWWILNIYWLGESEDHPLPEEFLPRGQ